MEILLPKRNDSAQTEKLSSRTVTVVGANGAGKSRFGVEIARRIQDHAFWLSAQKALCIMPPHEVWPGSIEAMYQEFMEYSYYVSKDTPTEFDQLLFLLLSEECRNLFEYKFKTPKGGHIDFPEIRDGVSPSNRQKPLSLLLPYYNHPTASRCIRGKYRDRVSHRYFR